MTFTSLLPQDFVVCLKLVAVGKRSWTYAGLAKEVPISMSGLFNAVSRARKAGLLYGGRHSDGSEVKVARKRLFELCSGALQAMFFPVRGEIVKGIPTALYAPSLKALAEQAGPSDDLVPLVWPEEKGKVRGESLQPIHRSAVRAAMVDAALYDLLALVDVVRLGRTKDRKLALAELERKILVEESGQGTGDRGQGATDNRQPTANSRHGTEDSGTTVERVRR